MAKNNIIILDTTLRDGEQTPGVNLNLREKLEIASLLEALGVDIIEAGFPAASPGDFESVRAVSQSVSCCVAALCRAAPDDILRGWEAVKYAKRPRLHVFLATSDIHMKYKLKLSPEEVLKRSAEGVRLARSLCEDVEFSCEDASRTDTGFLYKILEAAIDAGATTVNITDTVGYSMPDEFGAMIRGIQDNVANISKAAISVHCHNDLGLAVANTLSGISNGASQIETTINGLGERAGNCPMEELVMALTTRASHLDIGHNINTKRIYRTSQRVSAITGVPISVHKAIVGANAFAHESGIHQHGILANPMTYEIMTPQSVGKTKSTLVLGKLSGRHAFSDRLEAMGYHLTPEEIDAAFAGFKDLSDRKKNVTDDDLDALINNLTKVPEFYRMHCFQIQSGNRMQSMAMITLISEDGRLTEAATGDGPIDAAYNAAIKIVGGDWPLQSYDIKAVTEGMDALGKVTVRVKHDGEIHIGRGLSTDIIEASIQAYINAINRAIANNAKKTV